jgi:hypothetical protein
MQGLQNLVIVTLGMHCLMRGQELHDLTVDHLSRSVDPKTGQAKYTLSDQCMKNWQGGLTEAGRTIPSKDILANPAASSASPEDAILVCPVALLDRYQEIRASSLANVDPSKRESAFFLTPNGKYTETGKWYCNSPSSIGTVRARIKALFPSDRGITSHSLKRTATTNLIEANTDPELVQKMGGWKCRESMADYIEHTAPKRLQASAAIAAPLASAVARAAGRPPLPTPATSGTPAANNGQLAGSSAGSLPPVPYVASGTAAVGKAQLVPPSPATSTVGALPPAPFAALPSSSGSGTGCHNQGSTAMF